MFPKSSVLSTRGVEVIDKNRVCVVYSRDPNAIDLSSPFFNYNFEYYFYSPCEGSYKYPSFSTGRFSLSFIVDRIKSVKEIQNPTVLILFGGILFNIMIEDNDIPDYLLLTELDSPGFSDVRAGELNYDKINNLYDNIFTSQEFRNQHGVWTFKLFIKKPNNSS